MISVTILTKNSQKYLAEVLRPLAVFDEVLVYDTGSTDETIVIAKEFPNVTVYQGPFIGFGATHNAASALAKHDWILSIDSDEVATEDLVKELQSLTLNSHCVFSIQRRNYFNGKCIKWCGWYPDYQLKIYHRKITKYSDVQVHEAVIADGLQIVRLSNVLHHYPYGSLSEFLTKMQSYSTLFANQYAGKRKSSLGRAIRHGVFAFLKSYILKRGFLGGREGFIISAYNGHTAYYKYLKLLEANKAQKNNRPIA